MNSKTEHFLVLIGTLLASIVICTLLWNYVLAPIFGFPVLNVLEMAALVFFLRLAVNHG